MRYLLTFTTSLVILMTACSQDDSPEQSDEGQAPSDSEQAEEADDTETKTADEDTEKKTIAENLEEPWEIEHADGKFYVSERTGSIVTIDNAEQTRKPVQFSKDLSNQPEAGLLGVLLPDGFAETREAIAYYSYQENEAYYQRVATIEESGDQWEETSVLLDEIPGGQVHQGGRIEVGPDGKLYVTTGDATMEDSAQDLDSLAGKILRMNLDGTIPDDNPFEGSYVYSYGHRNSQGLAWNGDGELYATEHGSNAKDEINQIAAGNNYGWPVIRGDETEADMTEPLIHSGNNTWAPSGMVYHEGFFYFGGLAGEGLYRFDPENETEERIVSDEGRVRDVYSTEEGIYFLTNNTDGRGAPGVNDDRMLFMPNRLLK
ncbi:Glucose/arabinose dehydrogenase, beta-propeller fold [Lentibacillus persicus]|uniref:Glucose/arabinose dehydrogenase, beta-propeller fold n=1 Tax=Lentibacillus persicus TaxID=640948 RepID=A0A1I1ZSD6_9BACI|nr:PQQ-dependent sugar dehydrogenase [Lentibacillus persicus]SFE34577.1 Glucose/arabinose dehydrogenase, beta-propeller fold [Lentibacillus persicus]